MSETQDPPTGSRADRRVQDALDAMHGQRADFRRARQVGRVSERLHLSFQQSVLDVYDELRPYREEVEDEWDEATPYEGGLDALPQAAEQTVERSSVTSQGGVVRREASVEPYQIPGDVLLESSYDLDDVACELGFGSEIDTSQTRTVIDDDLIEEVEEWRRQQT